jgi:hypothetical protein
LSDWDLIIFETQEKKSVRNRFRISEKEMTAAGQHGKATVLEDENGKEWLLKTFGNIIDFEVNKIMDLEVDIHESPDEGRHRMHIWRVLNELTASRLGQILKLNVPKAIVVCSQQIADHSLEASSQLALGDVIILDDEEGTPETADEYYGFTSRESYTLEASQLFEKILSDKSSNNDSTTVLGLLMEKIPHTMNLDEYLDSHSDDFDDAFQSIREIDDGYYLLPFDIWLNEGMLEIILLKLKKKRQENQ